MMWSWKGLVHRNLRTIIRLTPSVLEGLLPVGFSTNVFLELLLFLIAHTMPVTRKVPANQDYQHCLQGVSEKPQVATAGEKPDTRA